MAHRAEEELVCSRCGAPLGDDPDDQPAGATDGLPLCGECERNRNIAADLEPDLLDGTFDGVIDV